MAASNNKLDIIARAASVSGYGLITSLDDNSDVAVLANQHYEGLYEAMLTQHAWKFARRVNVLEKLDRIPQAPWTALWLKPTDCLSLITVNDAFGNPVEHEERDTNSGTAIATRLSTADPGGLYGYTYPASYFGAESTPQSPDGPAVYATFTVRVTEGRLPADLAKALQYRMEAVFLRSAERHQEAAQKEATAEGLETRARVRDMRASSAHDATVQDVALARARGSNIGVRRFA